MEIPSKVIEIMEDIRTMKIRGAGKIARSAAKAIIIASDEFREDNIDHYMKYMKDIAKRLKNTRPTAVSLPNAVGYIMSRLEKRYNRGASIEEAKTLVRKVANDFISYSLDAIRRIGEIGSKRILDGDTLLTHCNSTAALSVIITAFKSGKNIKVLATETRPRHQGYITAKSLAKEKVPVTLIPDSSIRYYMKKVDKVIVGADTIAANGAVVNKVGTSLIALAAYEARVRVFVAAETYKFSPATVIGELVKIEEREASEVVSSDYLLKNKGVIIRNPAFDVTPPQYIDAIITEKGLISPQAAILILREEYGWALKDYFIKELRIEEELF